VRFSRKRQDGSVLNFSSGLRRKHLFITTCIEKQCTRPLSYIKQQYSNKGIMRQGTKKLMLLPKKLPSYKVKNWRKITAAGISYLSTCR